MSTTGTTKVWVALLGVATALTAGCADTVGSGGALGTAEREGLVFTREEEKLARDVYAALAGQDPVFTHIGESEQTHMDAIETLLDRHDVADPTEGRAAGDFENPDLQALHDTLVARGTKSRIEALTVGVEIEELDIADIEALQADVTHRDVENVYDDLTRGSRNHLRTFYGALVDAGGDYTPKHLDAATFDEIVSSEMERGP